MEKSVGLVVTQVQTESTIGRAGEQENSGQQSVVSNQQDGDTVPKNLLPDGFQQTMADSQYTELALHGTQRTRNEKIEKEAQQ